MTKSKRNKTIDFSVNSEVGQFYLHQSLTATQLTAQLAQNQLKGLSDQLILGDALALMPKLPTNSIDLAFIDPPYNLTKDFGGHIFNRRSMPDYQAYTRRWLTKLLPLLKPNASLYVACDWQTSIAIAPLFSDFGLCIQNRITWEREKGRGSRKNWKNAMEDLWFLTISKDYTFNVDQVKMRRRVNAPYRVNGKARDWQASAQGNYRDTYPSNFWDDLSIPYWSMAENTAHPTQKPEKLLAKLILASSNQGDLIFDPFLGSGTTAVTAKKLRRHYLGIESNPQYIAWAQYRLAHVQPGDPIQGYCDHVFWARNTRHEQAQFTQHKPDSE
ncbi:DNA-methyltransferase [Agrilactobacillus fermenti]|uniref:DNA-methyltransferase n=1 Tax=Agrilactobacillus fermenti TaxID=2586909 RepID=UPI001E315B72|nr:site-specific DNA-methyltransferase [Agrilactobacillus fermenti]MCD2256121.1 site-specific DNA-methyltransferase [Agrilactobacillus fermenti]